MFGVSQTLGAAGRVNMSEKSDEIYNVKLLQLVFYSKHLKAEETYKFGVA